MSVFNPIKSVTAISENGTVIGATITDLPCVSTQDGYAWVESDISGKKAGRRENLVMIKARLGMSKSLRLKWVNLTLTEISTVLKAFRPEYVQLEFLDPEEGGWITRKFYVSDREAACYDSSQDLWSSCGFTVIQQDADPS